MRFEYQEYPIVASEEFPDGVVQRPMVSVRVKGRTGSIQFLALLDTGADATLFPRSIAEVIGVQVNEARQSLVTGIGGKDVVVHSAEVGLEIASVEERYRWWPTIGFALFENPEEEIGILGHAGCLDYFVATFDGGMKEFELKPTRELLRLQKRRHR